MRGVLSFIAFVIGFVEQIIKIMFGKDDDDEDYHSSLHDMEN